MLRAAALAGTGLAGAAALRFSRFGLAGLILAADLAHDRAQAGGATEFTACLIGAARPRWCGRDDPREQALAAGFTLLVAAAGGAAPAWAALA